MQIQVKIDDNPDIANNQSNADFWALSLAAINANNPKALVIPMAIMGLPARSTYPTHFGAIPCSAKDFNVLEVA